MEELIDRFLREELRLVNKHLPRKRPSLCELLEMEVPYTVTSDGGVHVFDLKELKLLAEVSGNDCSLRLPIIVEYIPQGEGLYVVKDPVEARVVARVLGLGGEAPLVLYRSTALELRRRLRTTSTVLLSPGGLT